jgi:hypothetical protein
VAEDELRFRIVADGADNAARDIKDIADAARKLEGEKVDVRLSAEDRATKVINAVENELRDLSDDDKRVILRAEASQIKREIGKAQRELKDFRNLSDDDIQLRVQVLGDARAELARIEAKAKALDADKVDVTVDVDDRGASSRLKSLGGDLGAMGAAASSVAAAAAGVAATVVALERLGSAYQDAALGARDLAVASGLSIEDASRWQEVAGDLGVSTDTLAGALNRMNKAAASGTLASLGIQAGTTSERFLASLEALRGISDETRRAEVGSRLFGKQWATLAPLLSSTSEELRRNMSEVADLQVFDDEDVRKAEAFRDNMDALSDLWTQGKYAIGGYVAGAVEGLGAILDKITAIKESIPGTGLLGQAFKISTGPIRDLVTALPMIGDAMRDNEDAAKEASTSAVDYAQAQEDAAEAAEQTRRVTEANTQALQAQAQTYYDVVDAMRSAADSQFAMNDAARDFASYLEDQNEALKTINDSEDSQGQKLVKIAALYESGAQAAGRLADAAVRLAEDQAKASGATLTSAQRLDSWNAAMIRAAQQASGPTRKAILDYVSAVNGIPAEKMTEVRALVDSGDVFRAQLTLADLSKARSTTVRADANTATAKRMLDDLSKTRTATINVIAKYPNARRLVYDSAGRPQWVPAMLEPGAQTPTPTGLLATTAEGTATVLRSGGDQVQVIAGAGGSGTVNFNVNVTAQPGVDRQAFARAIVDALREYVRSSAVPPEVQAAFRSRTL